jgi:NhaB family Na+:H+ antiporter
MQIAWQLFLGSAPRGYKWTILAFLVLNPLLLVLFGPIAVGWLLLAEFIFSLAMALACYPLAPGGLLVLEAVLLGLVHPDAVYREVVTGFPVILLLVFMVAGIHFLRDLLLYVFSRVLVRIRSTTLLNLAFCASGALLSAFLDALTVLAVVITVGLGFYGVYHRVASGRHVDADHDPATDDDVVEYSREDLERFRAFLRSLLMNAAIGTTLGGVMTLVGEPQNLLVGKQAGWDFLRFAQAMSPVTVPVLLAGFACCALLNRLRRFGHGTPLPPAVRVVLEDFVRTQDEGLTPQMRHRIAVQGVVALLLVAGLALHVAEVGLVGLTVIVLATAFCGVVEEQQLGKAFEAALPFTALLVVFFAIVAVIHEQRLFHPSLEWVLSLDGRGQVVAMYLANGLLSSISDNVFVASIYIAEVKQAFDAGLLSREQFDALAVAVNTGTNIPSVATPNGQAAFLFLLTSALAPLIRLSYVRMMWMALPYFVTMTATGLIAIIVFL